MRKTLLMCVLLAFTLSLCIMPVYAAETEEIYVGNLPVLEIPSGMDLMLSQASASVTDVSFFDFNDSDFTYTVYYAEPVSGVYKLILETSSAGSRYMYRYINGAWSHLQTITFNAGSYVVWSQSGSRPPVSYSSEPIYASDKSTVLIEPSIELKPDTPTHGGGGSSFDTDTSGLLAGIKEFFSELFKPITDFIAQLKEQQEQKESFGSVISDAITTLLDALENVTVNPITEFFDSLSEGAILIWQEFLMLPIIREYIFAVVLVSIFGGLLTLLITF